MIIDGKEVSVDYRQAQKVQKQIDLQPEIPETAKVEVSPKDLKELQNSLTNYGDAISGNDYGYGMDMQANILGNDSALSYESRVHRYDIFDEMGACPFLNRGLQVIADDACQKNEDGNTIKIFSDDDEIKDDLEDLFNERLNINKELWSIFFETCKKGDNFYEIIPDSYEHPTQVARIRFLDPKKVNRIEKNGKLAFYTYKTELLDDDDFNNLNSNYETTSKNNKTEAIYKLQPWQIIHFKIADKDCYPYGGSLLKAGVQTYRRYSMLEDAMMVYRLARVPERRVFKIDVGNLSSNEAMRAVNRIKDNYRSNQILDDHGNINKTAAALSLTQDIFIPVREGSTGTDISTLAPGQALNNIDDIRHFRDELLWTLNIPPEYLGTTSDQGGGAGMAKGSLAMQDVKFARFVERIQYYIEEGLTKIASIELFFKKKKRGDLKNFKIELTPPSNVKELMDMEYINQKMNLIGTMNGLQIFPVDFILEYVMKMSKKEISDIKLFKQLEMQQGQNMGGGMDMMGGGMSMGGGMDAMGGGMPGGDMGAGAAPMMSVATNSEELQEKMVNIFGKDVLLENKDSYKKLLEALDDYNKEREEKLKEDKLENEPKVLTNELLNDFKNVIMAKEAIKTNQSSAALYYENEFGGLDFGKASFKIFGKGKKRTGPASKNSPRIIIEEIERKL